MQKRLHQEIDWVSTIVPLLGVLLLGVLFLVIPEQSSLILSGIRTWLGDQFSIYYALLGVGIFSCSMYVAFSKYGSIVLGKGEKPEYTSFQCGSIRWYSKMGSYVSIISLGTNCLGILYYVSCCIWFHVTCA